MGTHMGMDHGVHTDLQLSMPMHMFMSKEVSVCGVPSHHMLNACTQFLLISISPGFMPRTVLIAVSRGICLPFGVTSHHCRLTTMGPKATSIGSYLSRHSTVACHTANACPYLTQRGRWS